MNLPELKKLPTQEEVDELKAQVERFHNAWFEYVETGSDEALNDAFNKTPAQCLAEVRAQAVAEYKASDEYAKEHDRIYRAGHSGGWSEAMSGRDEALGQLRQPNPPVG